MGWIVEVVVVTAQVFLVSAILGIVVLAPLWGCFAVYSGLFPNPLDRSQYSLPRFRLVEALVGMVWVSAGNALAATISRDILWNSELALVYAAYTVLPVCCWLWSLRLLDRLRIEDSRRRLLFLLVLYPGAITVVGNFLLMVPIMVGISAVFTEPGFRDSDIAKPLPVGIVLAFLLSLALCWFLRRLCRRHLFPQPLPGVNPSSAG